MLALAERPSATEPARVVIVPDRPMTVAEAVAWYRSAFTDQYRRECLAFWRDRQGPEFVAQVEASVSGEFQKGRKQQKSVAG